MSKPRKARSPHHDKVHRAVRELCARNGHCTPDAIATHTGLPLNRVHERLKALQHEGHVKRLEFGKYGVAAPLKTAPPAPNPPPAIIAAPHPKTAASPRFADGARVQVLPGLVFSNLPRYPLDGWTGYVKKSIPGKDGEISLVEFDSDTLKRQPIGFWDDSQKLNVRWDALWLQASALAPARANPKMEQEMRQSDRFRSILGAGVVDAVPHVSPDALRAYHAYLARRLSIPFDGEYEEIDGEEEDGRFGVRITELLAFDPAKSDDGLRVTVDRSDGQSGLIPLAWVEVPKTAVNRKLLDDYSFWFYNWD